LTEPDASPAAPRRWRRVDGIVLLNKPSGLTSTQALQRVRRLLQAEKAGHAGTLDPMATGMLPLCFGQATKACGQLLGASKVYSATVQLGAATDTGDAEGTVVRQAPIPGLDQNRLLAVLAGFLGERSQIPPMYSALKKDGRPLYELARRGVVVDREPRRIVIHEIGMEHWSAESAAAGRFGFHVRCSKGTYIRVLAEEIAQGLGTLGHLVALRRVWVAPFSAAEMTTLNELEAWAAAGAWGNVPPPGLLAADAGFADLDQLDLDPSASLHLRQGRVLHLAHGWSPGIVLRAYDENSRFLGLVSVSDDRSVRVQRLFVDGMGQS